MELSNPGFSYFDAIIGAILLMTAFRGFLNGFIKEFVGLVGLIASVYIAYKFSGQLVAIAGFGDTSMPKLVGFLLTLFVVWSVMNLIATFLSNRTRYSRLSFLNNFFGAIVGGGKFFILFALILTAISSIKFLEPNIKEYTKGSLLYPIMKQVGDALIEYNPYEESQTQTTAA